MKKIYFLFLVSIVMLISSLKAQQVSFIAADANFETTYGPMTFSSNGTNIWQIGIPSKPFFGTASSPPNAIMTDTINPYPINNESSFILNNTDTTGFSFFQVHGNNFLTFDHKYQTTQGMDGGAVEVSYDRIHWQNFLTDTFWRAHSDFGQWGQLAPITYNMYYETDTLFNGTNGFSGNSGGWITSQIFWNWYVAVSIRFGYPPDSMFIRFTFYSDSASESLDGWMIDNIVLSNSDPSGIEKILYQKSAIRIFPSPSSGIVTISTNPEVHPITFSISDFSGRKIKSGTALNSFAIDVQDLENGIYQLGILTEKNEMLVKSMMVMH